MPDVETGHKKRPVRYKKCTRTGHFIFLASISEALRIYEENLTDFIRRRTVSDPLGSVQPMGNFTVKVIISFSLAAEIVPP